MQGVAVVVPDGNVQAAEDATRLLDDSQGLSGPAGAEFQTAQNGICVLAAPPSSSTTTRLDNGFRYLDPIRELRSIP